MIVSKKNKYIFVEIGRSGTTAIASELVKYYDGVSVCKKHTALSALVRILNRDFSDYYVFGSVRNPINKTISTYHKLGTYWTNDRIDAMRNNPFERFFLNRKKKFKERNESFEQFFLKFYKLPYYDWGIDERIHFTRVIRQESLQKDFDEVLSDLKLKKVRDIPVKNKTEGKLGDTNDYFKSKSIKQRAFKIFWFYCKEFDYEMPKEWSNFKISRKDHLLFQANRALRKTHRYFLSKSNNLSKDQINHFLENI